MQVQPTQPPDAPASLAVANAPRGPWQASRPPLAACIIEVTCRYVIEGLSFNHAARDTETTHETHMLCLQETRVCCVTTSTHDRVQQDVMTVRAARILTASDNDDATALPVRVRTQMRCVQGGTIGMQLRTPQRARRDKRKEMSNQSARRPGEQLTPAGRCVHFVM